MGIMFGLITAFSFGTADYWAGQASRRLGAVAVLFYVQFIGLVMLTVVMSLMGLWAQLTALPSVVSAGFWMLLDLAGILMLYQGLRVGNASIVAPIASSFSMVTLLWAFAFGDRLSGLGVAGIIATIAGVVMASVHRSAENRSAKLAQGSVWALLAALLIGTAFYGLRFPAEAIGSIPTVWVGRMLACLLLPVVMLLTGTAARIPQQRLAGLLLIPGILDSLALVSYNFGLLLEQTVIVITAASLFAVVTVVWGVIAGRERLVWNQWLGIVLTFVGLACLSVFSS